MEQICIHSSTSEDILEGLLALWTTLAIYCFCLVDKLNTFPLFFIANAPTGAENFETVLGNWQKATQKGPCKQPSEFCRVSLEIFKDRNFRAVGLFLA